MANNNAIIADFDKLEDSEKKLRVLARSLANRKLKVSLFTSLGGVTDQLLDAAGEMREVASALEKLVTQTQKAVNRTRVGFKDADDKMAAWFGMTED